MTREDEISTRSLGHDGHGAAFCHRHSMKVVVIVTRWCIRFLDVFPSQIFVGKNKKSPELLFLDT